MATDCLCTPTAVIDKTLPWLVGVAGSHKIFASQHESVRVILRIIGRQNKSWGKTAQCVSQLGKDCGVNLGRFC